MAMDLMEAQFIFWTELCHVIALVFSLYINGIMIRKAENTPQRTFYILVQSCALIWIISKICKTVAPTVELRWLFIVTQYLGISFLGSSFFLFSYYTVTKKIPPRAVLYILGSLSAICFLIMASNPLHHRFYSYFDFYTDRFGPLFYLTMIFQYTLMLISLMMISKKVILERESSRAERFIGLAALIPFAVNVLYIADVINPLFDITPIAMTLVLSLFALAAFKYHFLGTINLANETIRQGMEDPFLILNRQGKEAEGFEEWSPLAKAENARSLAPGQTLEWEKSFYRLESRKYKRRYQLEHWIDVSYLRKLEQEHQQACNRLEQLSKQIQEGQQLLLNDAQQEAVKRTQFKLHDILGHSMTQIIMLLRSAMLMTEDQKNLQRRHAEKAEEICRNGLEDIHTAGEIEKTGKKQLLSSGLFRLKEELLDLPIEVMVTIKGREIPLEANLYQNLLFCCKEALTNALKHGQARLVNLMLRIQPGTMQILIVDNGRGCTDPQPGMGIKAMQQRLQQAGGSVRWQSSPEEGMLLVLQLPLESQTDVYSAGQPVPVKAIFESDRF